jgi:hypothetical protein
MLMYYALSGLDRFALETPYMGVSKEIPPSLSGTPQEGNLRFQFDVNVKLWQIENKTNFIAFDID